MDGRRQDPAIAATYRSRLEARRAAAARGEALHARLAWARLALFFAAVLLVIALRSASAPWLAVPLVLFIPLAFYHGRVLNARDRSARAVAFYERGLARLENRWQGGGITGEQFNDPTHVYAQDLDLFGRGSLFELLATARTIAGETTLAGWLLAPASAPIIRGRQLALEELAPRLDLREDLAVFGPELKGRAATEALGVWATAPVLLTETWPRVVAPILAAISLVLVVQWLLLVVQGIQDGIPIGAPSPWLAPVILVQTLFAIRFRHRVHQVSHALEAREPDLDLLATLVERLETERGDSEVLSRLQRELRATGEPPSVEIRRLARLVDFLSSEHNLIFQVISAQLLLRTQLAFAVERWRARCGPALPRWIQAVAEYEALLSLAAYRAEHPDDPFPEIVDGPALFEGDGLAHPLLPSDVAVANDVHLGGPHPHLLVVSGSNMSGKSTLLRTVGVNAVLAQAGAPVRARRVRMTPMAIGATLRLHDSLQEGKSRFYAEITRISEIVALAKQHRSVLFLFDELLSGTNSHDRLQGATGILKGLVELGAIGLVTTHDLALTAIAPDNVHFEDRFEDGEMTFDYMLRPGVVRTGNAIPLMRSVGLDV